MKDAEKQKLLKEANLLLDKIEILISDMIIALKVVSV